MKKLLTISFILLMISTVLTAGTIQQQFNFEKPEFVSVRSFDRIVTEEGMLSIVQPGFPELPSRAAQVLLPAGEKVRSIKIIYQDDSCLDSEYNIIPNQAQYPISYDGEIVLDQPDQTIYSKNEFFPQEQILDVNTQYLRGHSIALFNLYPYRYNPITKEIQYSQNITVSITTESSAQSRKAFDDFYRNDRSTIRRLANIVTNPELISFYPQNRNSRTETHDYVIITSDNYSSYFNDFIDFKIGQGFNVLLKTREDIYNEFSGEDNQDKIRNFIIDVYQNDGAEYILLGGDTSIIPFRGFYVDAGGTIDNGIPSDLYYAALDRVGTGTGPDWNVDDDSRWGEHSEADYLSEVHVGRISADNTVELQAALNKQIMYQNEPVIDDLEEALMVGENLNESPMTWGGDYKDQIISGGYFDGYSTAGIDDNINVETLYDRDFYWSGSNLFNFMNNGLNLLNHLGHSNIDYNMKLYDSEVTDNNITANGSNHNFFIIYSQGCLPAAIDANCIAEKFTTIDNGCVVFVGNSRYGWYQPGGTNSSSQYLDRQFFDALFGEDIYNVGAMNSDSKDDGAPQCSDDWFRWAHYEVLVLGDPSIDVWTAVPDEINANYDPSISMGTSQIDFQTDAPFARIALVQDDELIGNAVADEDGDVTLEIFEPITSAEIISVSIIGHNKLRHLDEMVVITDQPYVVVDEVEIDDSAGNDNGMADFAETLLLNITLENVGTVNATNVAAVLASDDEYVTIIDDNEVYGDINAQSTVLIEGGFSIEIADDIPDQHNIEFTIEAASGGEYWVSDFSIPVNAPNFTTEEIVLNDATGNGNGILDPGETAALIIETFNTGHSDSPTVYANLTIDNDLIEIEESMFIFDEIPAQQSSNAMYTITADPTIEMGTIIEIDYSLISGNYSHNNTFTHIIGQVVEDFETGDFTTFEWEFLGDADWTISTGAYEGTYCAKTGSIGNNSTTGLKIETEVASDGEISFYRTVSSEANYDYLRFYIDGNLMDEWSGDQGWAQETYNVSEGEHTFVWSYEKDTYVTGGTDDARIDYIEFPALGGSIGAILVVDPTAIELELPTDSFDTVDIEMSNIGAELLEYVITAEGYPEWLNYSPQFGEIEIGDSQNLQVLVNTTGLADDEYESTLEIAYNDGSITFIPITLMVSTTDSELDLTPAVTELSGNYPNPFNPTTNIKFSLKNDAFVQLDIYNIRGQRVKTLINDEMETGYHSIIWDGKDDNNQAVSSGVYFSSFRVKGGAEEYTSVKKMIMMK